MTRVRDGVLTLVAGIIAIALAGCGAGAPPPDSAVVPAGQSLELTGPQVEIYTAVERVVILGFRIDFPRMRNVTYLVGFRPEQWEQVVQVPLTDLQEFQIRGVVDQTTFDRIYKNREQFSVDPQEFFNVQIVRLDGNREDLVAIIPKFRGVRDGTVWEMSMAGNPARIDRVVIRQ